MTSRSAFCGTAPEQIQFIESVGVPSETPPLLHLPSPLILSSLRENRLTQSISLGFATKRGTSTVGQTHEETYQPNHSNKLRKGRTSRDTHSVRPMN